MAELSGLIRAASKEAPLPWSVEHEPGHDVGILAANGVYVMTWEWDYFDHDGQSAETNAVAELVVAAVNAAYQHSVPGKGW